MLLFLGWLALACSQPTVAQPRDGLSVEEAVQLALSNNPEILSAAREVEVALARTRQAGRIPNPELQLSWNEIPTNLSVGKAEETSFGIVQSIEFPTKRSRRIDVATFDKQIAELRLERLKRLVGAKVRRAYYTLLYREEVTANLTKLEMLLKDFLQLASGRLESGSGDYLDVVRAKVEKTRLGNDIVESRREAKEQKLRLNILLGEEPQRSFILTDRLPVASIEMDRDSLLGQLMSGSVTLRLAQRMIDRQENELALAHSSYYPELTIGLFRERREGDAPYNANQFTGTTTTSLGLEIGVSLPLWFWNEPRGLVEEATASVKIAVINDGALRRAVRAEIVNALDQVTSAEDQVKVFDSTLLSDVDDILATGITRYRNNTIDALHLLDLYRTQREARMQYARSLLNLANAIAGLDAAAELENR